MMSKRGALTQDQNSTLLAARVAFAAAQRDFEDDDADRENVTEQDHDLIFSEFVEALVRFSFAKHKNLRVITSRDKIKLIVDQVASSTAHLSLSRTHPPTRADNLYQAWRI